MSHGLANPNEADMQRLKRCARYLQGTMNYAKFFPVDGDTDELWTYVDSDAAGDKVSRGSTSGMTVTIGGCNLVDGSKAQIPIALSSGEAEWYSAGAGASEAIHMVVVLRFLFRKDIRNVVLTDATVCKAIGQRQGVGKIKHLETKSLWLQQKIKDKVIYLRKVGTKDNLGDFGTKEFGPSEFERLREMNGYLP